MSAPTFKRGYFYPLDAELALDRVAGPGYIRRAVERALLEPDSARNVQRRRTAVAGAKPSAKARAMPP